MKKGLLILALCSLSFTSLVSCNEDNSNPDTEEKVEGKLNINLQINKAFGEISYVKKDYKLGEKIEFVFSPKQGYAVSNFTINNKKISVYENKASYYIDNLNLNLKVEFAEIVNISLSFNEDGGKISYRDTNYKLHDELHLIIEPKDGYYLQSLKNGEERLHPRGNECSIILEDSNINLVGVFKKIDTLITDFQFSEPVGETVAIKDYKPAVSRIPSPVIIPETTVIGGKTYKVTKILNKSFDRSAVTSIKLSKNILEIEEGAFEHVSDLKSILVDENNPNFSSVDNALFNKDKTTLISVPNEYKELNYNVPNSVKTIAPKALSNCRSIETITMGDNVVTIGAEAFSSTRGLNTITLSNKIEEIPASCFKDSQLLKINIPDSVVSIGDDAFSTCPRLNEVTFGKGLKTIGSRAFQNSQIISELKFNEGLEKISNMAFDHLILIESLAFPSTLKEIGTAAFENCLNLQDVKFNDGLLRIGGAVFAMDTKLKDVILPASLETIDFNPFYGNENTKITVAEGNTNFKVFDGVLYDFDQTRLINFPYGLSVPDNHYEIPETVVEIAEDAFATNRLLESLVIPTSVKKCVRAFENLIQSPKGGYRLSITYKGTKEQFAEIDHGTDPFDHLANFYEDRITCVGGGKTEYIEVPHKG